jgi:NHL repeat
VTVKRVSLKVSPQAALRVPPARDIPFCELVQAEPLVVLGNDRNPEILSQAILPSANSCFGPRGACLTSQTGPLWICDTGHHRLLGWRTLPESDKTPADWCIGQKNFSAEGRNGKGDIGPDTVNVPTGICVMEGGLVVADTWNHRILVWKSVPRDNNTPADIVLGQKSFSENLANRGADSPTAQTLHWPCGVQYQDGKLLVADTGNRRVLIWTKPVLTSEQPADIVLGQVDFVTRDENAGSDASAMSMRWPHAIAFWKNRLCVTDAGNNRILVWNEFPYENGLAAHDVLGQSNSTSVDFNQSFYWPRANTLNMPYGVTSHQDWLIVADTANSRLVAWREEQPATENYKALDTTESTTLSTTNSTTLTNAALFGQRDFHEKGDNRWQPASVNSLCWPYGVQCTGSLLTISDSGNNRVSIWRLAI